MNALRKKSAVQKVKDLQEKGLTPDEALEELKLDEAKYSDDELATIKLEFPSGDSIPMTPPSEDAVTLNEFEKLAGEKFNPKNPNANLNLSKFDYKNLTGDSFKKYVQLAGDRSYRIVDKDTGEEKGIVGELKENDLYDFEQYRVDVVMKPRFPGVAGTPYDFNGVKIRTDRPELATRIPIKTALELNAQILNAHSRAGHGKYYLLKK